MEGGIRHWVELWDYLDHNLWALWQWSAAHLRPEAVGWQPIPQVASIGWNLQHLGEMLDYYLANVFSTEKLTQPNALVTMKAGSLDDGRYQDLQAIASYHRQVRPRYRAFLANLQTEDLDKVIAREGRMPITYAWPVGHIAEHESYHLGKCTLLRSLLLAGR
jgi:uncharacterized damage-inducible protein DinB